MRRWPTWLLVGALAALGATAVADALRGHESKTEAKTTPTAIRPAGPLIPPNEPSGSAMSGVLYYSDPADGCRIHGIILPTLEAARVPKLRSCRFSLAASGQNGVPGEAAWSPHGGLYAREIDGMVELASPFSHEALRFPGRAPAFKPDGTFTFVRQDVLVEWTTDCPPGSSLFTLTGDNTVARCRRVALSPEELRRALPGGPKLGPLPIKGLAWLSNTRLVAIVGDAGISGYRELLSVVESGEPVGPTISEFGEGLRVEASPRGSFFTAWYGSSLVTIRDRNGDLITFPPLPRVAAVTWSPDERWTAVATRRSVFVFRTNESEARVRRLPIVARDLAWR
jgi:hypothetical protein